MSVGQVGSVRADIQQMIDKIRDFSNKSPALNQVTKPGESHEFGSMLKNATSVIDKVNSLQGTSGDLKTKFLQGDPNVSMADVVVASEKSKLALEGLIIVRNKCLEAYKDIMNMPA